MNASWVLGVVTGLLYGIAIGMWVMRIADRRRRRRIVAEQLRRRPARAAIRVNLAAVSYRAGCRCPACTAGNAALLAVWRLRHVADGDVDARVELDVDGSAGRGLESSPSVGGAPLAALPLVAVEGHVDVVDRVSGVPHQLERCSGDVEADGHDDSPSVRAQVLDTPDAAVRIVGVPAGGTVVDSPTVPPADLTDRAQLKAEFRRRMLADPTTHTARCPICNPAPSQLPTDPS